MVCAQLPPQAAPVPATPRRSDHEGEARVRRRFWEGFTPAALPGQPTGPGLHTVFCTEGDWRRAEAEVTQAGGTARLMISGEGDLEGIHLILIGLPGVRGSDRVR